MSEQLLVKRPVVATVPKRTPVIPAAATLVVLGLGVFLWLSDARAAQQDSETALPALETAPSAPTPTPIAAEAQPTLTAAPAPTFSIPNSGPVTLVPTQNPTQSILAPPPANPIVRSDPMRDRLRAPALIVDLAQTNVARQPGAPRSDGGTVVSVNTPGAAVGVATADRNLSDTEQFAARVGSEEVEVAQARRMTGLDRLVPQGAIIGAVMETALNSDQPGFARAVTQRDVYSFDGTAVLIPAGSRVIGQYKSGVAQGASRLFVLWTRLIRPDGVSIELASPAVDELGRGGIGGKVNRHYLQRFGGAILTSVLTGGLSALAASRSGGSTVIVGSAGQASSVAGQASQSNDIPPTITTRQGAAVRIFVARDLDFSRVGPAG